MAKMEEDREGLPALVIENSTVALCGINQRNDNRQPVTLGVCEGQ